MLNGLIFMAETYSYSNPLSTDYDVSDSQIADMKAANAASNYLRQVLEATDAAKTGTLGDAITDAGKNIVGGALTGVADTASFATGLAGLSSLSEGIAGVSKAIEDTQESLGSLSEQGKAKWYQIKQQRDAAESQAKYEADKASGMSDIEAISRREARNFASSVKIAFSPGHANQVINTGFGSLGSDILLTGGMSAVAKTAAKALPTLAKSASALANTNKFTQGIAKNAPWMTAVGMQEGGNQYRQTLNDVLDMDNAELME